MSLIELRSLAGFEKVRNSGGLFCLRDLIKLLQPTLDYASIGNAVTAYKLNNGTIRSQLGGSGYSVICVKEAQFPQVVEYTCSEAMQSFIRGAQMKGAIIGSRMKKAKSDDAPKPRTPVYSATIDGKLFEASYQDEITEIISKVLQYAGSLEQKIQDLTDQLTSDLEHKSKLLRCSAEVLKIAKTHKQNAINIHKQMLACNVKPRVRTNGSKITYVEPTGVAA
jgi:hypothetical protein